MRRIAQDEKRVVFQNLVAIQTLFSYLVGEKRQVQVPYLCPLLAEVGARNLSLTVRLPNLVLHFRRHPRGRLLH